MNKKSTSIEILEGIMDECRLREPLSREEKKYEYASSKRVLKGVLKTTGITTFFTGLYFSFYFLFKKLGISLLALKIIVSGAVIAGVSAGTYVIINKVIISKNIEKKVVEKQVDKNSNALKKEIGSFKFKAGFKPFLVQNQSIPKELINQISNSIINECNKQMGFNFAGIIGVKEAKYSRFAVIGYIEKLNNEFIVNLKIMDSKTGELRSSIVEYGKIDNIDELGRKCAQEFIKKYQEFK